jgi:DNA-binding winged helix-turn-helix (wHTH) protein/tetratricopeptide (TPR) repeat protein
MKMAVAGAVSPCLCRGRQHRSGVVEGRQKSEPGEHVIDTSVAQKTRSVSGSILQVSRQEEMTKEFVIAHCRVRPSNNTLERDGKEIVLEPRVMDVLATLASRPEHVFSRDELAERVWDDRPVSDEAVNRAVFELRKAFRQLGVRREVVSTVRKRGYRLKRTPVSVPNTAAVRPHRALLTATLVVIAVVVSWYVIDRDSPGRDPATEKEIVLQVELAPSTPGDQAASVVLKTLEVSLAEGLSPQKGLIVRVPDEERDESFLMPLLRPDYRLEGQLNRTREGYTLNLELKAASGGLVWTELLQVTPTPEQIEKLQNSVSRSVSMALVQHFRETASCRWADDLSALETYFEAQRLISLRGERNIRDAISMLKSAIEITPDFARAWSSLAWAYGLLPAHIEDRKQAAREVAVLDPLAQQAAHRALEICPTLIEAFLLVGSAPEYSGDNPLIALEYILRRALAMDPGNGEITRHSADILFRRGRLQESKVLMQRALEINPYNARIYREMADYALNEQDFEWATQLLNEADRLGYSGKRYVWWRLHALTGDWDALEQTAPDPLRPTMSLLATALAEPDNAAKREAALAALRNAATMAPHDGLVLAHHGAIWLGADDLAWEAHGEIDIRSSNLHSLWWTESASFRAHPQFERFWREMNLLEYWHHVGPPDFCDLQEETLVCPESI